MTFSLMLARRGSPWRFLQRSSSTVSFPQWIEEVAPTLKPPVANKLLFGDGQLKVMIVGGPNQRKDYHVQDGEELFWQVKGDMRLDIVEKDTFKQVVIPEGHGFLLPPRIPHSPQRFENSVGIVFERAHLPKEMDGLRWYNHNDTGKSASKAGVLYEEYFHCTDLGSQLAPIIQRFNARGPNDPPRLVESPPTHADQVTGVEVPVPIQEWLEKQCNSGHKGTVAFLQGQEFMSEFRFGASSSLLRPPSAKADCECFVWQIKGTSQLVNTGNLDGMFALKEGDMHLVSGGSGEFNLNIEEQGTTFVVYNTTI